ncbi:hypothetical protein [Natrononativus amylolyticus]|nr:hypothetical protein [Natrononativus amylolyticus]
MLEPVPIHVELGIYLYFVVVGLLGFYLYSRTWWRHRSERDGRYDGELEA